MSSYGLGFLSATAPWMGSADSTITFGQSFSTTGNATKYDFNSVSLGSDGLWAVAIYAQNTAGISVVSFNGTSGTKAVEVYQTTSASVLSIWYATVSRDTTAFIDVTCSDQATRCAIATYKIVPGYSSTPSFTASLDGSVAGVSTVNILEVTGGVSLYAFLRADNNSYTPTRDGTSLTPDVSSVFGGPNLVKFGDVSVTGNPNALTNATYEGTSNANQTGIAIAHWR